MSHRRVTAIAATRTRMNQPGPWARPAPWRRRLAVGVAVGLVLAVLGGAPGIVAQPATVEGLMQEFGMRALSGPPPPFSLLGLDGQPYSLERGKGHLLLLYFWATW